MKRAGVASATKAAIGGSPAVTAVVVGMMTIVTAGAVAGTATTGIVAMAQIVAVVAGMIVVGNPRASHGVVMRVSVSVRAVGAAMRLPTLVASGAAGNGRPGPAPVRRGSAMTGVTTAPAAVTPIEGGSAAMTAGATTTIVGAVSVVVPMTAMTAMTPVTTVHARTATRASARVAMDAMMSGLVRGPAMMTSAVPAAVTSVVTGTSIMVPAATSIRAAGTGGMTGIDVLTTSVDAVLMIAATAALTRALVATTTGARRRPLRRPSSVMRCLTA